MVKPAKLYKPGEKCPASGIYNAWHADGCKATSTEVLIALDRAFPSCPTCKDAVRFSILRAAPFATEDPDFKL